MTINSVQNIANSLKNTMPAKQSSAHIKVALWLVLFCISSTCLAQTIQLFDQFGHPLSNAVVAITLADTTQPSPGEGMAVMDQIGKQFVPRVLIIQQGQYVSFPNSDDIRHHVYSFSAAKPFEIKLYKGAVSEPVLFEKPGIVVLGCNIHDNMLAYIYVAQHEKTYLSNEFGLVDLPAGSDVINIWHANLSSQNNQRETVSIAKLPNIPDSTVIPITLNLTGQQNDTNTHPKSSSKFKKKFN